LLHASKLIINLSHPTNTTETIVLAFIPLWFAKGAGIQMTGAIEYALYSLYLIKRY
jgi:hypothetical protein